MCRWFSIVQILIKIKALPGGSSPQKLHRKASVVTFARSPTVHAPVDKLRVECAITLNALNDKARHPKQVSP